jgi:hypothetical protein
MLSRKRSGRTYSLTSYTGVGQAPPNSLAANPAAVAAASTVGHSLSNNTANNSGKRTASADHRHSIVGTIRSPSLSSNTKRFSTGTPTVKTTTKRVVNPDRSLSLTTTTIKNLGKFEITTTKTTPLKPPPPKTQKKTHRKSSMRPPAAGSIHESDLESLKEDSLITLTPPRKAAHPKISFSPVTSIDEQDEPVRHSPPPRSVSPSKPALKDISRTSSLTSGSTLQVPKRRHSVSFTDFNESKISSIILPANAAQHKRHSTVAGFVHPAANSAKLPESPTTPPTNNKTHRNSIIRKSSSASTVSPSLSKTLGVPVQIKRQTVKERGEERHLHTLSGDGGFQHKPSMKENAAPVAVPKSKSESVKTKEHKDNSKLAAAASSVVVRNHHIPTHNTTSTKHTHTNNLTKPVAAAAAQASNNHHHYRTLAYGDDTGVAGAAAAAGKKATNNIKVGSAEESVDEEYPAPVPIYSSDEEDVISMSSESSWKRGRAAPAGGLTGFRKTKARKSNVTSVSTGAPEAVVTAPPTTASKIVKSRLPKKVLINGKATNETSKPLLKSVAVAKTPTQPAASMAPKRESQLILKRTPSVSSFEREGSGSSGSAFKLMSLRDRKTEAPDLSGGFSSVAGNSSTAASSRLESSSFFGGSAGFSSRFTDSGSEDEMTTANTRANIGTPRFIPANVAVDTGVVSPQKPSQHGGRKFFRSSRADEPVTTSAGDPEEKKKRFKGLRKVLGLK